MMQIGIISDTHDSLPEAAYEALKGSDEIFHAGDIGSASILFELQTIAPVTAVLGNNDHRWEFNGSVQDVVLRTIEGVNIKMAHIRRDLSPLGTELGVCIFGHTHLPLEEELDGILFLNPGSPSRSRGQGHTVAQMVVNNGEILGTEIIQLP